ncbi:MAG: hypothetical protein V1706_01955 [Pseudomonadota bacterium]
MTGKRDTGVPDQGIRMATVYMHAPSGRSMVTDAPSAAGVKSYQPLPETVEIVKKALVDLGFSIEAEGVSLSISGPPALFDKYCSPKHVPGRDFFEIKELGSFIEAIEFAVPGALL